MRAWKFVAIVAVVLTLLCFYQLSFTFKSRSIEDDAKAFAQKKSEELAKANPSINKDSVFDAEKKNYLEEKWDKVVYNFLGAEFTLKEVKKYALNLGLDLQGGTHATVVVAPDDVIKRMSNNSQDPTFLKAVANAKAKMGSTQSRFTDVFLQEWKKLAGSRKLNEVFISAASSEITFKTSDDDIIDMINQELDVAVDRSVIVLRSRVDEFGATNPIIQPVKSTGRIEVDLPGFDNEALIRTQLEKVANLEFVEPYSPEMFSVKFQDVKAYYDTKEKSEKTKKSTGTSDALSATVDSTLTATTDSVVDTNALAATTTDSGKAPKDSNKSKTDSLSKAKKTAFDNIFENLGGAIAIKAENLPRAKRIMATEEWKKLLPSDLTLMFNKETEQGKDGNVYHIMIPMKKGENTPVLLEGKYVEQAYPQRIEGKYAVGIQFTPEGAQKWAEVSRNFKDKAVAIVLDNEVYSTPVIQEEMTTGNCQITGDFSYEEVSTLSNILKAGKLPAPTIIERLVKVGPSLGVESIKQGLTSLFGGLFLVVLFMILYYNKSGIVAVIALLFNILFILGIMATPSYGVTLTLDGIAGIVLTIGMAVDANVLIFERIKEELSAGQTRENSIKAGFGRAFWTIFDANITTFASALVLFVFGTGLVKGFAVTLMIGVVCSFFSAVFISQLIIYLMGRSNDYKALKFSTNLSENLFKKTNIDFIGMRKMGYIFSTVVLLIGLGLVVKDGLNLGVAFKGGNSYIYSFDKPVSAVEAREEIKKQIGEADVQTKQFGNEKQISITTSYLVGSTDPSSNKKVQEAVETGLAKFGKFKQQQSIEVGATIADDIKSASLKSLFLSVLIIFIYIAIRFRNWQFGLGTLVALFHDVFFVVSCFAIARLFGLSFEIDEIFIAALLTLVGYSVNDTVVVFDFIRDYIDDKNLTFKEIINKSLNNTMSRTIMTSLTVLFVVLALFIFGGDALRGFSFALLVGVLVGTYSSLFIATPLVYDTTKGKGKEEE